MDFPTVAASGNDVYVAYTNSNTGAVRLAISHDRGATWKTRTIGSTTASSSLGRIGYPSVAVSGANVVVAWATDGSGSVSARRSADRGSSWSGVEAVTDGSTGVVSAAARGSRIAIAWSTGSEIHARVADGGTWGPDRLVGGIGPEGQYAYSPAIVLQGSSRLAVAWSEQLQGDFPWSSLKWTESADDGAHWFETQVLASTGSSSRRSNDWPSVLWPSEATRQVLWSGWTANTINYRLYFRAGTGTPVGPATAAEPAAGPASEPPVIMTTGEPDARMIPSTDRKGASR